MTLCLFDKNNVQEQTLHESCASGQKAGARSARSGSEDAPRDGRPPAGLEGDYGSYGNYGNYGSAPGGQPQALGNTPGFTDDFCRRRSVIETVDADTGEIRSFERGRRGDLEEAYDDEAAQVDRWLMLRHAQRLLSAGCSQVYKPKTDLAPYSELPAGWPIAPGAFVGPLRQRHSRVELPDTVHSAPRHRTSLCFRKKVGGMQAEVWQSRATQNASFHRVSVCGSPWTCPMCSRKINLGRRAQIKRAYEAIDEIGGAAYMLTFTTRHGVGDSAAFLVGAVKEAMQLLQKSQAWKEVTRTKALQRPRSTSLHPMGYVGRITALEATHGANGWHPHEHQLWFYRRELTVLELAEVERRLFAAWREACLAVGLPEPVEGVGLDVRRAESAADYVAKAGMERRWGVEKELAGSHVKVARKKGRSVFQLLYDASQGDSQAGALFVEFANTFKGRHQLQFSRTLLAYLRDHGHDIKVDTSEEGDQALASELEADSQLLGELTEHDFERIVCNDAHATVLLMVKKHGFDRAVQFIRELPARRVVHQPQSAEDYFRRLNMTPMELAQHRLAAGLITLGEFRRLTKPVFT